MRHLTLAMDNSLTRDQHRPLRGQAGLAAGAPPALALRTGGGRGADGRSDDDLADARRAMVDLQIHARGIRDPALLAAMREVPRHEFVAASLRARPTRTRRCRSRTADHLAAVHRRADARGGADRPRATGSSRSAPARATRARSRAGWPRTSMRSSAIRACRDRARTAGAARLRQRRRLAATAASAGRRAPYDAIVVAAGGPANTRRAARSARGRRQAGDAGR